MKSKAIKIGLIIIGAIIILMILIPLLFKGKIEEIIKEEANKNLNAEVNFESVGLNLFSSFPNLSLSVDNLSIVNKAPFEGDTLFKMNSFKASIDLFSAVFGDGIKINSIKLIQPSIFVCVLEDSSANYNIFKPSAPETEEATAPEEKKEGGISFTLKSYIIKNADIAFIDKTSNIELIIKNLTHEGSGDFTADNFALKTETLIEELTVAMGGINYLKQVNAEFILNIDVDNKEKSYRFSENSFRLNNLLLKLDGGVKMPDTNNIEVDFSFATEKNEFKNIISLIPAVYKKDFDQIKSSGSLTLKGFVKGIYNKNSIPGFEIKIGVDNGSFQTAQAPTPVDKVFIDFRAYNPGGNADYTVTDLRRLSFEIAGEKFEAALNLRTPISNPFIDAYAKGKIDLSKIKDIVAVSETSELSGVIEADFKARGAASSAQSKNFGAIDASGKISFRNIALGGSDLPEKIKINQANLFLSPKSVSLNDLSMSLGKSDLKINGKLENVLPYLFNNETINGSLSLYSNYFDCNPYIQTPKKEKSESSEPSKSELKAVELPERVKFSFTALMEKVIFDNLTLENLKGIITLENQILRMNNLQMNLLGGSVVAVGSYNSSVPKNPKTSFKLNINSMDIGKAYESFVAIQTLAPIAKYVKGGFSSSLDLTSELDETMTPDWNSFFSVGGLSISEASVEGFKPFEAIGDQLKIDELKNPRLKNIISNFKIENGKFYLSPVNFNINNSEFSFYGSSGIDKSIDYKLETKIPAKQLKQESSKALGKLFNREVDIIKSDKITVVSHIKGTFDNPAVHSVESDLVKEASETVKDEVKKEAEKKIEETKEIIEQKFEETKKQAADTVKSVIEKKADELKKKLPINPFKK